jgi:hypothetical protein
MTFLPKFSPRSSPISSRGAFSSPSGTSSRDLTRPSFSQALMSARNCGNCAAKSETMNPRNVSPLTRVAINSAGTRSDPGGASVWLYWAMSPQTGTRAKSFRSGSTASKAFPPTFSK